MPPESDGLRTVGCSLERLVLDRTHLQKLRDAVNTVHKATILATELLNMHLRRMLRDDPIADLSCLFNSNWLMNAFNEVTCGKRTVKVISELRATRDACMPPFEPPDRTGVSQCLLYAARNLATTAATNVWNHFRPRVRSHVKLAFAIDEEAHAALTATQRGARKLEMMQVAADICRMPDDRLQSPAHYHAWISTERDRLAIDAAVGQWDGKPLLYHLKAKPHRFLYAMLVMSADKEHAGRGASALYPLRRSNVPKHVRFDQVAIRDLLGFGKSAYIKERQKQKRKRQPDGEDEWSLPPLQPDHGEPLVVRQGVLPAASGRQRRSKEEMLDENAELFGQLMNLKAAGVHRRQRFDYAFTTDGVCARLQMRSARSATSRIPPTTMPSRGLWAIDQLKHLGRVEEMHTVGVDPGKRELIVGVDADNPRAGAVRYTQRQRARELRSKQYAAEAADAVTEDVSAASAGLAGYNSRTADPDVFCMYCRKRHETLDECLACYANLVFRRHRWKVAIKEQQSEERLYKQLEALQNDERPIVLAYGSWGMVAGQAGAACNRGNPPCIGVGLMRKLARRFVVAPTPEAYTSKTCCRCLGECGPWAEVEERMRKRVRGLRRCTQRDCKIPLNRDKNGAINIGKNFQRLMRGESPIRCMTAEDLAFHRASMCLECG